MASDQLHQPGCAELHWNSTWIVWALFPLAFDILSLLGVQKKVLMRMFQKGEARISFEALKGCSLNREIHSCISFMVISFLVFLCG